MIEIAFAACSILQGAACREDWRLSFDADPGHISAFACATYGQVALAQWAEGHPNWRITSWTCRPAKAVSKA